MAPSWMTISNVPADSLSKPSNSAASTRCPVEETGMNSVSPSTIPRRMMVRRAASISGRAASIRRLGGGPAPAAPVAGEPALGDGGERRRADSERFEAGAAAGDDIVALKHQPLVPADRRSGKPAGEPGDQPADRVGNLD